jgi:hypothetical protein
VFERVVVVVVILEGGAVLEKIRVEALKPVVIKRE